MKKQLISVIAGLVISAAPLSSFACEHSYTFVGVTKTKDNIVEIYSTKIGPHYTVREKGGKILATTIDAETLAQNFPHLEALMVDGHANTLDASLGIEPPSRNVLTDPKS